MEKASINYPECLSKDQPMALMAFHHAMMIVRQAHCICGRGIQSAGNIAHIRTQRTTFTTIAILLEPNGEAL